MLLPQTSCKFVGIKISGPFDKHHRLCSQTDILPSSTKKIKKLKIINISVMMELGTHISIISKKKHGTE